MGSGWKWIDRYLPETYTFKRIPHRPVAIDPTFVAQRMLVQHSHFTLHGSDTRGIDEMLTQAGLGASLLQVTLNFDEGDIDFHRLQLALLGISETTIFPDLEGLARELRFEYHLDSPRRPAT